MGITIENVKVLSNNTFFTRGAGRLPMAMSVPSITGGGVIDNPALALTNKDYYNMIGRDKLELETKEAWNFANANANVVEIDDNTFASNSTFIEDQMQTNSPNIFENPLKLPQSILEEANRYNLVYKNAFVSTIDFGTNKDSNGTTTKDVTVVVAQNSITQSLFNPLVAVNTKGIMQNVPLLNDKISNINVNTFSTGDLENGNTNPSEANESVMMLGRETDLSDCSIKKLVELSNDNVDGHSKLGMARYKWADFMYCKDLGKYSNNMLITLRRFPHPIGDNIFTVFGYGDEKNQNDLGICPDIGRMIAWLGDENKLEDIIKFSFQDTWKELHSSDDQQQSKSDDTPLGQLFNLGNPTYMKGYAEGRWGSGNNLLERMTQRGNSFVLGSKSNEKLFDNHGTYEGIPSMNGQHYDQNKVYTKQGTVQDTHIYDGRLVFEHSFSLVFNYQLRAYENINPKSAFLDLIGNILSTTYRKGNFWGGSKSLIGAPGNNHSKGWDLANKLINKASEGAGYTAETLAELLGGSGNAKALADKISTAVANFDVKEAASNVTEEVKKAISAGKDFLSGNAKSIGGLLSAFTQGSLSNALGRPAIYAFNSLLTGDPVGLWHVTIGNPRNPILSMGNLIVDNTSFQMYGPLGIDDFPTGIKVTVSLKHAKSRDASEIANMFTRGETSIVFKLLGGDSMGVPEHYFMENSEDAYRKFGTKDRMKILSAMASAY